MKTFLSKVVFSVTVFLVLMVSQVHAQCAMCSLTAQAATENGNSQGFGLNDGILFLLAMPYLAVLVVGILWYRNYRKKPIPAEH